MVSPSFHDYGPSHLSALAVTAGVLAVMCFWARSGAQKAARVAECALAAVLLLEWPGNVLLAYFSGNLAENWDYCIPGHLCDVASIIGGLALLTHQAELCELLYFWGLAGTLQGLLTPNLQAEFPAPRFFAFFAVHSGVVIAALYVVLGLRITPRRGALWRCMAWLLVYAVAAGTLNALLGTNYGFLRSKPEHGSLLDVLGPWPWYIGSLLLVAFVFFTILDLPWLLRHRAKGRGQ